MNTEKPILNVVSTVKSEQSSELKWQIKNFGLFLNSKAGSVYQKFGPLTTNNVQFILRLSKRKSPENESDKLELELQKPKNEKDNFHNFTANLKGKISIDGDDEWVSEFVLDFASSKHHLFATPFSSFNSESTLTFKNMTYEQIVIQTDVLNSWVMRLDDSFMMTRSGIELTDNDESTMNDEESIKKSLTDSELIAILDPANFSSFGFENLELASKSDNFDVISNVESSKISTEPKEQEYDQFVVKHTSYPKKYPNLDDEWLKSLDELLFIQCFPSYMNFDCLKITLNSLKEAHRELYKKLQKQFQFFSNDCLEQQEFKPEADKFEELDILVVYFNEILKKLSQHQEQFDESTSTSSEFWPVDEFSDYSQEKKWLEKSYRDGVDKVQLLTREIKAHCKCAFDYYQLKSEINALWDQSVEKSELDLNQKIQWIHSIEGKMDYLQHKVDQTETECFALLVRPVSIEKYGEYYCKLAQLKFNLDQILKTRSRQQLIDQKQKNIEDLEILTKILSETQRKAIFFPDFYANHEQKLRFISGMKRHLELAKETIKSLDARVLEPTEALKLDNLKDQYDQLFEKMSRFETTTQEYGKYLKFHKAIESIHQLHSNITYIMNTADSKTLLNYETELCKCLAEMEAGIQTILSDGCQNENLKLKYNDTKSKTDWIAVQLKERLEPWRQFVDLFSSIEKSHKAVGELIAQLSGKQDTSYDEVFKDIELLESVNAAFEDTRKDITFIRQICCAGQMKSAKLASEAQHEMQKINRAHGLVENGIKSLLSKLKRKASNPFYRRRRGFNRRRQGGSSYDPYY